MRVCGSAGVIRGWRRTVSLAERPQESRRARACYTRLPRQVVHDPNLAKELSGSVPLVSLDEGGRLVVDFGLCPFGMLHVLILDHVAIGSCQRRRRRSEPRSRRLDGRGSDPWSS